MTELLPLCSFRQFRTTAAKASDGKRGVNVTWATHRLHSTLDLSPLGEITF